MAHPPLGAHHPRIMTSMLAGAFLGGLVAALTFGLAFELDAGLNFRHATLQDHLAGQSSPNLTISSASRLP
ncbi:MAG: hypothetical protein ACRDSR_02185 [Pseudonocardiaceae bacterium]